MITARCKELLTEEGLYFDEDLCDRVCERIGLNMEGLIALRARSVFPEMDAVVAAIEPMWRIRFLEIYIQEFHKLLGV